LYAVEPANFGLIPNKTNPRLSVIIANLSGMPEIGWCLAALEKQQSQIASEVIVVQPGGTEAAEALQQQFPWVHWLSVDPRLSIPKMHNTGLEYSQGEIIAILEDHEVVLPGWCEAVLAAHNAFPEAAAIAGPIENGCTGRIIDWATFFCEYCRFMPPVQAGVTKYIPGNNVAYKRWALQKSPTVDLEKGFWENTLYPNLLQQGFQLRMEPRLKVSHQKHMGFFEYLGQRYHYSRAYAGARTHERSLFFRLAYSVACTILPIILLKRILSYGFSKHLFRKELVLSTPLLACFTITWAFGEMVGSLFGPGKSLAMIK
jgi:glycosyltransferase involved in cell wall biosynthesis